MPVAEIEKLMESPIHEARAGALSIMGQCAKDKKCSENRLKELYDLYVRRHDRINNWDLVDLAAHHVVGRYLADKRRDALYKLAISKNQWERRTSIVATAHFILKQRQVDDTFAIAEILVNDSEDLVNKGTGWMLRTAGDVDRPRQLVFLDKYAAAMPRVLLRYSIEKLDPKQRDKYLKMKSAYGQLRKKGEANMPETNKEIVEKVNAAFEENKPEVFLSYCADNAVWRMIGDRDFKGKEAIKEFMASMEGMEPPNFRVEEIIAGGDSVACYGDMKMKDEDGKEGDYSFCDIYHFKDGKITNLQTFIVKHKSEEEASGKAA